MHLTNIFVGLVISIVFSISTTFAAELGTEAKIANAISSGPAHLSADATVIEKDGTVLREGTNGWTCIAGDGDHNPPSCNDAVWMKWFASAGKGQPFSTDVIGYSYMLAGSVVDLDDPKATDRNNGGRWYTEGPHLMILMPSRDLFSSVSRDAENGGPYVIWPDTPMEFVVVPLGGQL